MRRMMVQGLLLVLVATAFPLTVMNAAAQGASTEKRSEAASEKSAEDLKAATTRKAANVYRVDFTIREIEGGRVLNSRKYMLMVEDQQWARTRVGNRIPYRAGVGEGQWQYQDVGINIDCKAHEPEDRQVLLDTRISAPSLAAPEPSSGESSGRLPVLRNLSMEVTAAVTLGKPTIIGSMDDVTSNHRYEIEATVTPVK